MYGDFQDFFDAALRAGTPKKKPANQAELDEHPPFFHGPEHVELPNYV